MDKSKSEGYPNWPPESISQLHKLVGSYVRHISNMMDSHRKIEENSLFYLANRAVVTILSSDIALVPDLVKIFKYALECSEKDLCTQCVDKLSTMIVVTKKRIVMDNKLNGNNK